jgi:GTP-binding protein
MPRPQALLILLLVKQLSSTIDAFPLPFPVLSSKITAAGRSTIIVANDDPTARPAHGFRLHAAPPRRSGGGSSGSTKKASKSNGSKQKKGGLIFKQQPQRTVKTATSSRSQQQKPVEPGEGSEYSAMLKTSKSKKVKIAPPWQVLNAKEAQKNVQKEIERRSSSALDDNYYTPSTENPANILSKAFLSETEARLLSWKPFSPYSRSGGMEVEFVGAHTTTRPPRLGVPEIAFLGRSNCGKSSLLNALLRHDVARVGKTPGATASVNLYSIYSTSSTSSSNTKKNSGNTGAKTNESASTSNNKKRKPILGLVDLPGFGYAKLSKSVKEDIGQLAEDYLNRRKELALAILLVDIRRTPQDDDKAVLAALYDVGVPVLIVATKLDKLDGNYEQRERQLRHIRDELGLPDGQPLAVSSVTGDGCRLLWRIIMEACEDHVAALNRRYTDEVQDDDDEEEEIDESSLSSSSSDSMIFGDDDEEIAYEQGYDWIQGTAMLEPEDDDDKRYFDVDTDLDMSSSSSSGRNSKKNPSLIKAKKNKDRTEDGGRDWDRMTIQDWDRKSRDLEERGLL